MLIDNRSFRRELEAIVHDRTPDPQLRQDLLQAVLLHVCQLELDESAAAPARTESWYLKHCLWFLRDLLGQGSSLDAYKRRHLARPIAEEPSDEEAPPEPEALVVSQTPYHLAALRDSLRALRLRLDARSTQVLDLWVGGSSLSEIARHLRVSQSAVTRRLQNIAREAGRLEPGTPP